MSKNVDNQEQDTAWARATGQDISNVNSFEVNIDFKVIKLNIFFVAKYPSGTVASATRIELQFNIESV